MSATDLECVYLVRHGQTEWNTQGRRQGQLDSPLTPAGLRHAEATANLMTALDADRVFSSPLGRARTTATVIASTLALPVDIIDDLREVHHGRIAGLTDAQIERDLPHVAAERARDKYQYRYPGGESYADADRRAEHALDQIGATGTRRPLIVAHEMIGRMLLRNVLGLDPQIALGFSHPHDVVYRISIAERQADQVRTGGVTPFWPPW